MKISLPKKITNKHLAILAPVMIFQLLLPLRPIALFLVEVLHIPYQVLSTFAYISVPITLLTLSLYLIQRINLQIFKPKPYIIGFILAPVLLWILLMLEGLHITLPLLEQVVRILFEVTKLIPFIYSGWDWGPHFLLQISILFFVIVPIIGGILSSFIFYAFQKTKYIVSKK